MSLLGVVMPTKNSVAYLARHVDALSQWADLADEIVVVDSFSTDGTVEFLKSHLQHPGLRFLSHPPGLYQSWNHGLHQIQAKYAYLATVGDTISRDGLTHLLETAGNLQADVVVTKPAFVQPDGSASPDITWPIDDLLNRQGVSEPRILHPLEVLLFTATHLDGTLLGSCASNLFRSEILQKFPFPTGFGKAGDAAWAATHFADVRWAASPRKISTFLRHPLVVSSSELQGWKESQRMDRVLRQAYEVALTDGRLEPRRPGIREVLELASVWLDRKEQFDRQRKLHRCWILHPAAWQTRMARNRARLGCIRLRDRILTAPFKSPPVAPRS